MNEFIPLMVIIPMLCALLVSTFSNFNRVVKIIALIVLSLFNQCNVGITIIYIIIDK